MIAIALLMVYTLIRCIFFLPTYKIVWMELHYHLYNDWSFVYSSDPALIDNADHLVQHRLLTRHGPVAGLGSLRKLFRWSACRVGRYGAIVVNATACHKELCRLTHLSSPVRLQKYKGQLFDKALLAVAVASISKHAAAAVSKLQSATQADGGFINVASIIKPIYMAETLEVATGCSVPQTMSMEDLIHCATRYFDHASGPNGPTLKAKLLAEVEAHLETAVERSIIGRHLASAGGVDVLRSKPGGLKDLMFMIFGGFTTRVSNALNCLHLLAEAPMRVQDELAEALCALHATSHDTDSYGWRPSDCLLLDAVVRESQRLAPVPSAVRREVPPGGAVLAGHHVSRHHSKLLLVDIYSAHREPKVWGADAGAFRPMRWLELASASGAANLEEPLGLPPGAFMPFGLGLRACPGIKYAQIELRTCVGAVVRAVRFASCTHAPPQIILRGPASGAVDDLTLLCEVRPCREI